MEIKAGGAILLFVNGKYQDRKSRSKLSMGFELQGLPGALILLDGLQRLQYIEVKLRFIGMKKRMTPWHLQITVALYYSQVLLIFFLYAEGPVFMHISENPDLLSA